MKILRIRLKNLNSLRGEHEINFEAEPLASAGLFAIVGPTGAGKSTLLDALTLALYGQAARYANTPNPEDMMSRHCGECQAEVEFEVASGRYRAEWQLRRAHGKPDGKVQAPKRRIYDQNGLPLTQALREAEEWIEKQVGLDYSRFLRSVLLAQGEFARFLKASPDERAELLESLTGTEIYSELSLLAHVEGNRRQDEVRKKQEALDQVILLTAEERSEREQQCKHWEAELRVKKGELEQLNNQRARAKHLQSALAIAEDFSRKQQALALKRQAAEPELARLATHRETLPFADNLSHLETAIERSKEEDSKKIAAERDRQKCWQLWITGIAAACQLADSLVQGEQSAIRQMENSVGTFVAQEQGILQWMQEHSEDKELESSLPELATQLSRFESSRSALTKANTKRAELSRKLEAQEVTVTEAQEALEKAVLYLKSQQGEEAKALQHRDTLLDGRTVESREEKLEALRARSNDIQQLITFGDSCQKQQQNLEEDRAKLEKFAPAIQKAQKTLTKALSEKEAVVNALELHQDHLHKTEIVASLEEHRSRLVPGEACPLCGATEHPYADPRRKPISVETIQAEMAKAKAALSIAEERVKKADQEVTRLSTEQAALTERIRESERQVRAAQEQMQALGRTWQMASLAAKELARAVEESANQITILQKELKLIEQAKEAAGKAENSRLKAEHAVGLAKETRANAEKTLAGLKKDHTEQSGTVAMIEKEVATFSESLTPLLQAYRMGFPEPGQEQAVREALEKRKRAYQDKHKNLQDTVLAKEKATQALEKKRIGLGLLRQKAAPFRERLQANQAEAHWIERSQVELLGRSWQNLEKAEAKVRELEDEVTKATATIAQCKEQAEKATRAVSQLSQQLSTQLAGSVFSSVDALRAARLKSEEVMRLEKMEQELKSEADQLLGKTSLVRRVIWEMREVKVPEGEALTALEQALTDGQKANDVLVGNLGQVREELRRDATNRQQHATQAARLEEERKRLTVWKQLQDLIGSHDGRKFRRYAQGISLDILVEHANQHLQRLSERYRMERRPGEELQLEIEDLYQANVRRPMASLSGGESFIASLALALGLADLAGRSVRIDSLFIDEGFGYLDAETLDVAISTLETLRQDKKMIGVISHVELLKERIATQIRVEKQAAGRSTVRVV